MNRAYGTIAVAAVCGITAASNAQWVDYAKENSRVIAASNLILTDDEEKDYAVGDFDQDGDDDIAVMRKTPFTSNGPRANVLLMNEGTAEDHPINGVLVDRTAEFASAADDGGNGFFDLTNDRDADVVDVNNDGWPDLVTVTTLSDGSPKTISHPRIYFNLGESGGEWLGFEYQEARIPQLAGNAPNGQPHAPRFCSSAIGDVNNDGYMDIYFGDYDSGGSQTLDFNNRLLINQGASNPGFYTDETTLRLNSQMYTSAFGASSEIHDFNGDGAADILKQTSLDAPTHVSISYNNPANPGMFLTYDTINANAPYFVTAHDTTGNGEWLIGIADDGTDHIMIGSDDNLNAQNEVIWTTQNLPGTGGFGGDVYLRDLNKDGLVDIIITDVDVDIPGCSRSTFWFRNTGNNNFSNTGSIIPGDNTGIHNVAVLDINGDTWMDIVVGHCDGTDVYMNQPPVGMTFSYPNGLSNFVEPDVENAIIVKVTTIGTTVIDPGSHKSFISVNDGPFVEAVMPAIGTTVYEATLAAMECIDTVDYYFEIKSTGGDTFRDPPGAPAATHSAIAAESLDLFELNNFEDGNDVSGWTVTNDPSLTSGAWELVEPVGSLNTSLEAAAPFEDNDAQSDFVQAWVTQNGTSDTEPAFLNDVDGGPTTLTSPVYSIAGTDAVISYARWIHNSEGPADAFITEVTSNGTDWEIVHELTSTSSNGVWETVSFQVGDYVTPSGTVQFRVSIGDTNGPSVTEGGVDTNQVDIYDCGIAPPCVGDTNGDLVVNVDDLVNVITDWGTDGSANGGDVADNSGSGSPDNIVDVGDLVAVISNWGDCL